MSTPDHGYDEDSIKSLDWVDHIRLRPTMYIGKLGDGSSADDGLYILVKEAIDNPIDEFVMGYGKQIKRQGTGIPHLRAGRRLGDDRHCRRGSQWIGDDGM